jgi:hypothetical protein
MLLKFKIGDEVVLKRRILQELVLIENAFEKCFYYKNFLFSKEKIKAVKKQKVFIIKNVYPNGIGKNKKYHYRVMNNSKALFLTDALIEEKGQLEFNF